MIIFHSAASPIQTFVTISNNIEVYEAALPQTKIIPHCAVKFETGEENRFLPAATKLGQGNIFTGICLSTGGRGEGRGVCLSACWDTPPDQAPPREQTSPRTRPPRSRHLPTPHPHPPRTRHPPREADSSIPSTSGRYASYWNAFLLYESLYCGVPVESRGTALYLLSE